MIHNRFNIGTVVVGCEKISFSVFRLLVPDMTHRLVCHNLSSLQTMQVFYTEGHTL